VVAIAASLNVVLDHRPISILILERVIGIGVFLVDLVLR
jgi:hypothetical protein